MSAMNWGTPAAFPAVYEELLVPGFFREFAIALLDRAALRDGEAMLDVATGTGIVLRLARERTPGAARLVGLDLTPGMLAVAREVSDGLDIEYVDGDATALPFEDASFDLVTCQQGLQFFPDRELALREFRRVLAPGGRVVLACWAELAASPGHELLAGEVERRLPGLAKVASAPFSLASASELERLFAAAGYGTVEVERIEGTARFATAEDFTRSFMEGSPMALALAEFPRDEREALASAVTDGVRDRFGVPVAVAMATHLVAARA